MNDKYLKYNLDNFLNDVEFIRDVKSGKINDFEWRSWLSLNPSKQELIKEAKSIISNLRFTEHTISENTIEDIWQNIGSNINNKSSSKVIKLRRILVLGSVAASIAIFWFFNSVIFQNTSIDTGMGQQLSYTLPDASRIDLNAGSKIKFNAGKWEKQRTVFLEGEAFFEVRKGGPFRVNTPIGFVEVMGTSFNVFSRNEIMYVRCKTGKVMVVSEKKDTSYLMSGDAVSIDKTIGNSKYYTYPVEKISQWRAGLFVYEEGQLSDIFEEIERQFDVDVNYNDDLDSLRYTGSFRNDNLGKALYAVCWPMHLDFEIKGGTVNIRKK